MAMGKDSDIIWSTIIYDYDEICKILDLRKWSGARWVVDIDDNLYAVSSDNPAQENVKLLRKNMEVCLSLADGVTVSVPTLKNLYSHLNENIYVNPNGTDLNWWKPKPKKHKGIRIGWRGAYGHRADVTLIEPAIKELKKKYDITFVSFGVKPPFESEHKEWVGFLQYPEKLAELDLDIAVVPLIDSSYNRCKSNIAIQEFSALKIPVVASPTENQKGMPILYAKNNYEWYENLEKLIKSRKLRKEQAENQYNFVKTNYNLKKLNKPLAKWFEDLPRKDIEPPK